MKVATNIGNWGLKASGNGSEVDRKKEREEGKMEERKRAVNLNLAQGGPHMFVALK